MACYPKVNPEEARLQGHPAIEHNEPELYTSPKETARMRSLDTRALFTFPFPGLPNTVDYAPSVDYPVVVPDMGPLISDGVDVLINITYRFLGNLDMELTNGVVFPPQQNIGTTNTLFTFAGFNGQPSAGTWTVTITDTFADSETGTIHSMDLTLDASAMNPMGPTE